MRSLVYRSHALGERNDAVTRAVVIVHGGSRDADTNFRHVLAAGFLAGALENTVIVSPRFASNHEAIAKQLTGEDAVAAARAPARDRLAPGELNWVSQFGGRHWNAGGVAANAGVTSYLKEHFSAEHRVVVIDGCGHHTRCMLADERMLPLLFP